MDNSKRDSREAATSSEIKHLELDGEFKEEERCQRVKDVREPYVRLIPTGDQVDSPVPVSQQLRVKVQLCPLEGSQPDPVLQQKVFEANRWRSGIPRYVSRGTL